MRIDLTNLNSVLNDLGDLIDETEIIAAVGKGCAAVERSAKQKAPKDTGALRNSITSKVEKDGSEIVGTVFTPLEYAPYVEYGTGLFAEAGNGRKTPWTYYDDKEETYIITKGQHPQPFLRPSLAENRDKIIEQLIRGIIHD